MTNEEIDEACKALQFHLEGTYEADGYGVASEGDDTLIVYADRVRSARGIKRELKGDFKWMFHNDEAKYDLVKKFKIKVKYIKFPRNW